MGDATGYGYPCPECGQRTGLCRESDHDEDGRRVRRRSCTNCALTFTTIEVVSPLSLYKLSRSPRRRHLDVKVAVR